MHSYDSLIFTVFNIVNILQCIHFPVDEYLDFKKITITNNAVKNILSICFLVHKSKNFIITYLQVVTLQHYTLLLNYAKVWYKSVM